MTNIFVFSSEMAIRTLIRQNETLEDTGSGCFRTPTLYEKEHEIKSKLSLNIYATKIIQNVKRIDGKEKTFGFPYMYTYGWNNLFLFTHLL